MREPNAGQAAAGRDAAQVQRRLSRIRISYYLRLFDEATGAMLGHVADISAGGMMVVSEHPIADATVFKLWMDVPAGDQHHKQIYLEAQSVWSRRDSDPDFYNAGFRLIDPSPAAVSAIRELIDQFAL